VLESAALHYPHRDALRQADSRSSYAVLRDRCRALAAFLRQRGLEPLDRLAVLAPNSPEFLESTFAAAGIGLVLVPLNTRLTAGELGTILRNSDARALIACGDMSALAREAARLAPSVQFLLWIGPAPAERGPGQAGGPRTEFTWAEAQRTKQTGWGPPQQEEDALAQLYFTSGSTGEPKGVMLTHRNVSLHAQSAVRELGLSSSDVWGHFAPMFHLADAWATIALTLVGGCHVFAPRFDEELVLGTIEKERVTLTNLIPTMLNRLVKFPGVQRRDFSSMRLILSGGASIPPEVVRAVMATFCCTYVQTYGMTETSPYLTLSLLPPHLERLSPEEQFHYRAKTGRTFHGVELRLVDEAGHDVAADGSTVGEIWARGPTVTPGYWRRPDLTAAAFSGGWLRTGDLATLDPEGFFQIVDRKKDMINTGGEKVYSTEVESVLHEHPAVFEAAVFGVPSEEWGEEVRAAVVLRPGANADGTTLREHCRARLAAYKCPKRFEFLPELPKTGTGKLSKALLRERFGAPRPETDSASVRQG
jgi:acyl-CoA synthetase (AMP-forming)/AMP-acid ligase II